MDKVHYILTRKNAVKVKKKTPRKSGGSYIVIDQKIIIYIFF